MTTKNPKLNSFGLTSDNPNIKRNLDGGFQLGSNLAEVKRNYSKWGA